MTEVEIRPECHKPHFNRRKGQSCTEDNRCPSCVMKKHREDNAEVYQKMGEV